jgi:hypothetical protein
MTDPPPPQLDEVRERCHWINVEGNATPSSSGGNQLIYLISGFYNDLRHFAEYGPWFQMIKSVYRGEDEFLVEIDTRRQGVDVP